MNIVNRIVLVALLALSAKLSFAAGLCGSDSMFFNGSHTSWVAEPMMCNDSNGKWQLKNVLLPENSLVGFDIQGDWKHTLGGRGGLSGKISKRYENIWIAKAGIYDIEIDLQQKTYSFHQAESQDIGIALGLPAITSGLLPDSNLISENNPTANASPRANASAYCSDAECTRQYNRDSAYCRSLQNARARAICWAAAAARYGACLAQCR